MSIWTTEPPTEDGFYWLHEPNEGYVVVEVRGDCYLYCGWEMHYKISKTAAGARWFCLETPA